MGNPAHREVEHQIRIDAPGVEIYRLLENVDEWPGLFSPTIHVEQLERTAAAERIRIWATANETVKTWVSRRMLDPDGLRIDFRQEVSSPPVAAMGGSWLIEPISQLESRVRLRHDYRAVDDEPRSLAWIDEAVDRNSRAELSALKANVEQVSGDGEELVFSFEDEIVINGAATDVYDFLNEAHQWQARLPHVARVVLTEESPGLQVLEMDTRTADGATHTTRSVRVCFPHHKIVYKQIGLPALLTLHTGRWQVTESAADTGDLAVTSQHTVAINKANIGRVLGADAGAADARSFIRDALGRNSLATLHHAKDYAERHR
jgi:aromatase